MIIHFQFIICFDALLMRWLRLHHHWFRNAAQRRAQAIPHSRSHPAAQGQDAERLPSAAGLLRGAIHRERLVAVGACTHTVCFKLEFLMKISLSSELEYIVE